MRMHPATEGSIREQALRIEELNRLGTKALLEYKWEVFIDCMEEFIKLKNSVKLTLVDFPVANIHDPKIREILIRLSEDGKFEIDKIGRRATKKLNKNINYDDLSNWMDFDQVDGFISDYLYSWFGPVEYINDLCKIGSLIIGTHVPENLHDFVGEARQCFAFRQYQAVYALCRTILEVAVRDVGQKRGKLPKDSAKVKHDILRRFGEMKSKAVPRQLRDEVGEIYDLASGLIHGNKIVNGADAAILLRRTLFAVQELYR